MDLGSSNPASASTDRMPIAESKPKSSKPILFGGRTAGSTTYTEEQERKKLAVMTRFAELNSEVS